jgi:hypothetical protein
MGNFAGSGPRLETEERNARPRVCKEWLSVSPEEDNTDRMRVWLQRVQETGFEASRGEEERQQVIDPLRVGRAAE